MLLNESNEPPAIPAPVGAGPSWRRGQLASGVDIVEIERFSRYIELGGDRFLRRVYSTEELANCRGQVPRLAGRFAAKEAIAKALGTGIRGIGWREMEACCATARPRR
jgi:holo-[acyl-carrier protein] synthase